MVESVVYFFNKLDVIGKEDWVPSNQDILAARVRTHGIVTTKYTIEDRQYEMYDVGGQRNERRKWAHCFVDSRVLARAGRSFRAIDYDYRYGSVQPKADDALSEIRAPLSPGEGALSTSMMRSV